MSVYVDNMEAGFGRMIMCHMWADTLEELFDMADRIGVQRRWLQRPVGSWDGADPRYAADARLSIGMDANWVHFDIAKGKRAAAVKAGAIETDAFGPGEHTARLDIATGLSRWVDRGQRRLQMYADARARHAKP